VSAGLTRRVPVARLDAALLAKREAPLVTISGNLFHKYTPSSPPKAPRTACFAATGHSDALVVQAVRILFITFPDWDVSSGGAEVTGGIMTCPEAAVEIWETACCVKEAA